LGVKEIRLITNHPLKMVGLGGYGLKIVESIDLNVGDSLVREYGQVHAIVERNECLR
jgi:3,4-dihydroxy 2-butanone 4-phosphate synthase/GTP cyclohydrolase II